MAVDIRVSWNTERAAVQPLTRAAAVICGAAVGIPQWNAREKLYESFEKVDRILAMARNFGLSVESWYVNEEHHDR